MQYISAHLRLTLSLCVCVCVSALFFGSGVICGLGCHLGDPKLGRLPVTCYHLPFTCCPDTIKLQSQLCVLLPITLQLLSLLLLLSLLPQLISRAQSQLEVKAKNTTTKTLDNANANAPNDTVIVGHCFCPIIGNTLQNKYH